MDEDQRQNKELAAYLAKELAGFATMVGPCWFVIGLIPDDRPAHKVFKGYHINTANVKRWEVSGCWPHDATGAAWNPGDKTPRIAVSKSRGREVLVAEIRRRFADVYDAAWSEMRALVEHANEAHDAAEETRRQIIEQFGGHPVHGDYVDVPGLGLHELRVGGTGNVIIKTYGLPVATALKVLAALRDNPTD
jgi:hypothetical protein